MIVVSRSEKQAVLVGADVEITVVEITGAQVVLQISTVTGQGKIAREMWIGERDDLLEITDALSCAVIDVRSEKVRLGIIAPRETEVMRKEVAEALSGEASRPAKSASSRKSSRRAPKPRSGEAIKVELAVDDVVSVGSSAQVSLTDIDPAGVRIKAVGTYLGGPNDGARLDAVRELAVGSMMSLGVMVGVSLLAVRGGRAVVLIRKPVHMVLGVERR